MFFGTASDTNTSYAPSITSYTPAIPFTPSSSVWRAPSVVHSHICTPYAPLSPITLSASVRPHTLMVVSIHAPPASSPHAQEVSSHHTPSIASQHAPSFLSHITAPNTGQQLHVAEHQVIDCITYLCTKLPPNLPIQVYFVRCFVQHACKLGFRGQVMRWHL